MGPVTITLNFPTAAEAAAALTRMSVIAPMDRPDVGRDPEVGIKDAAVCNGAVTPLAPTGGQVPNFPAPLPGGAPSTVAAAVFSTAPTTSPPAAVVFAPPAQTTAPAAAAPTAPAAPTNPAPVGIEVDTKGLPWDNRIHGSTKTKNADGSWRSKRGVADELVAQVTAELKAAMAARAPSAVAPVTAAAPPSPASSGAATMQLPVAPIAAPPANVAPPAPPAGETFGQLMARLAVPMATNPIVAAKINEALAAFGLTALAQLAARPDLVGPAGQTIDAMLSAVPA